MFFSDRTPQDMTPNAISMAIEAAGNSFINLTQSNPTQCGFHYPQTLLNELSDPASLLYQPQAFGLPQARQAVAHYLAAQAQLVLPENVILTASTSEAYGYLFKLLGNPGDSFLVPTPGYPLLDHLLHLEGLELISYPIQTKVEWPVDIPALQAAITPQSKGIIAVNPHNPTGAFLSESDQTQILRLCEEQSLAYISDEVFAEYAYQPRPKTIQKDKVLTFRLGGLSKSLGLPQLKLSWIVLSGPKELVAEAKDRFELIADTYLSVNTPVQTALTGLLAFAPDIQKQILTRVLANRAALEKALNGLANVKVWPAQGGWYALVEVLVEGLNVEELVIKLLKEHQVLVQPGGFYDFPTGNFLVLSLLPQTEVFEQGIEKLKSFF